MRFLPAICLSAAASAAFLPIMEKRQGSYGSSQAGSIPSGADSGQSSPGSSQANSIPSGGNSGGNAGGNSGSGAGSQETPDTPDSSSWTGSTPQSPPASSSDPNLSTTVTIGDTAMNWGDVVPTDALSAALNSQCGHGNQCDTGSYTYSSMTDVCDAPPGTTSGSFMCNQDNLVFQIDGNWANEGQRQALIAAMVGALGVVTQNNGYYDPGSFGTAYTSNTPGGQVNQFFASSFVGISIVKDNEVTIAQMSASVSEVQATGGWCGAFSAALSAGGAVTQAVESAGEAVEDVAGPVGAVFGFISAMCQS